MQTHAPFRLRIPIAKVRSSSAVADKPARRAASRQTAKFFKESRDHNHAPLLLICHPVVRIDVAYSCTKFDDFRVSRSSDMIGYAHTCKSMWRCANVGGLGEHVKKTHF